MQLKRARQVRGGVQTVDREAGTDRVHSVDRAQSGDAGACRGVHEPRPLPETSQHFAELRELRAIVGDVGVVGRREVREDPVDLDTRERADGAVARRGLLGRGSEAREPRVDFEMDARDSTQRRRGLAEGPRASLIPHGQNEILGDGMRHLG